MSERDLTIRPFEEGDETGYIAFMNTVFPNYKCDIKRWRWEFKDNPLGFLQTFAVSNGEIVGHIGLVPVPMKIGDRLIRGSLVVDLAVHPDFRRQGIFLKIGKKLVQDAEKEGVIISYTLPNEPAYRGHLKYGWFYVFEIPILTKVLSLKGFLYFFIAELYSILRRGQFQWLLRPCEFISFVRKMTDALRFRYYREGLTFNKFKEQALESFDSQIDRLWEETSKQFKILVVRNKEYLNWRYVKKPYSAYIIRVIERKNQIEGYVILSSRTTSPLRIKEGYIVDIFAKSESAIHCLIQSAIVHFSKENVDLVTCWMIKERLPYYCLIKRGFVIDARSSQKLICRINSSVPELKELYHKAEKEWFFTMGDSDWV